MAHLHRLIVALVLCLVASHASALVPLATQYATNPSNWGTAENKWAYTKAEACSIQESKALSENPGGSLIHRFSEPTCGYCLQGASGGSYCASSSPTNPPTQLGYATRSVCPPNSAPSGGQCVCNVGFVESGTSCVEPAPVNNCSSLSGQSAGRWNLESTSGALGMKQVCDTGLNSGDTSAPGCLLTGQADFCAKVGDKWICQANLSASGGKCMPDPDGSVDVPGSGSEPAPGPDDDTAPSNCPPGKVPGTVNGTSVCVDPGKSDSTKNTGSTDTTTTNPDGSTTSTETTKTTECNGTTCTTTTTTTTTNTPAGGGSSTTETTSTTGTCTVGSSGCGDEDKDPSRFGGSCAAFSCDGDAIMCAVALEQHKRNCQLFVDTSVESALYDSEKGKTGPQYTSESVTLSSGSFSQANALGAAAQCIQDRTVTVAGHSVVLPFSQVCSTLQHLGTVLMFISFLVAYRIVARG